MSGLNNDSKTFVDSPMKYSIEQTLRNFEEFMEYHNDTPSIKDVDTFVKYNFEKPGKISLGSSLVSQLE